MKLREEMIKDGSHRPGRASRRPSDPGLYRAGLSGDHPQSVAALSQRVMLSEFYRGNNIGLKAGGSKTYRSPSFPGEALSDGREIPAGRDLVERLRPSQNFK